MRVSEVRCAENGREPSRVEEATTWVVAMPFERGIACFGRSKGWSATESSSFRADQPLEECYLDQRRAQWWAGGRKRRIVLAIEHAARAKALTKSAHRRGRLCHRR